MKSLVFILTVLALVGCVSASNETQFDKVKPKQRVYVGQVQVKMNGQKAEKCELFVNSDLAPNMKLSEDGFVVYKTSDRKPYLGRVRCLHKANNRKSAWHTQKLNLAPLKRPKKRKSVNYFGHILVNWDFDPEKTLKAPAQDPSSFRQVGLVDDSGELQIEIKDQSKEAADYIQKNWVALKDFRLETHLVTSETADEDEELDEEDED